MPESVSETSRTVAPSEPELLLWSWLYAFCWITFRCVFFLYFRGRTYGTENVPREGGFLLVSNHGSNLDPPLVAAPIRRIPVFLAKDELRKVPILGFVLARLHALFIRRSGVDRHALKLCTKVLREGHPLIAFPEGTRTVDGSLGKGKAGVAMLGAQAAAPCLPVFIEGSHRAMPRKAIFPRPRRIRICYGAPFDLPKRPKGASSREHYQNCADIMMGKIEKLRNALMERDKKRKE